MVYSKKRKSKKLRKSKIKTKGRKHQRKSFRINYNKIGGIGIIGDSREAFEKFVGGSSVSLLNDTSGYGLIFQLHNEDNNPDLPVNYYSLRTSSMMNKIKNLVLKMSFIIEDDTIELKTRFFKAKTTITRSEFRNESRVQIDIYNRSKENFEPICPSIVQELILDNESAKEYLNNLKTLSENDQTINIITQILLFLNDLPSLKIGLIGMEMMENAVSFNKLPTTNISDKSVINYAKLMCLYEHYRLFKLGYFHGDFHLGNCLFEPDTYYIPTNETPNGKGRVILLDFGATFRHNIPISRELTLNEFISYLLRNTSPMWEPGTNLRHSHYQWVRDFLQSRVQHFFKDINNKRQNVIVETMQRLSDADIDTNINLHTTYGGSILQSQDDILQPQDDILQSKINRSKEITGKNIMSKDIIELEEMSEEMLKSSISEKIKEVYNDDYLNRVKNQLRIMNTTIPKLYEEEERLQKQIIANISK